MTENDSFLVQQPIHTKLDSRLDDPAQRSVVVVDRVRHQERVIRSGSGRAGRRDGLERGQEGGGGRCEELEEGREGERNVLLAHKPKSETSPTTWPNPSLTVDGSRTTKHPNPQARYQTSSGSNCKCSKSSTISSSALRLCSSSTFSASSLVILAGKPAFESGRLGLSSSSTVREDAPPGEEVPPARNARSAASTVRTACFARAILKSFRS